MTRGCGTVAAVLLTVGGIALGTSAAFAQDADETQARAETTPGTSRYAAPVQEELERLGLHPLCESLGPTRTRCTFHHVTSDARHEIVGHALYSDESDTVYVWIPAILTALPDDPAIDALLRRLMELNWSMLATKLEWNPTDGEVRISAVQHTDSNFDRRAFRNLVRVVLSQAERYRPALTRLLRETE